MRSKAAGNLNAQRGGVVQRSTHTATKADLIEKGEFVSYMVRFPMAAPFFG